MFREFKLIILFISLCFKLFSQSITYSESSDFDYSYPKEYEVGGITISGIKFLNHQVLINLTGLNIGEKIQVPGEKFSQAIKKLWSQGLFSDIKISASKIEGDTIFLDILLQERPRLSKINFTGVNKSEKEDLNEKIHLIRGSQVTDNIINNTTNIIKNHFIDKGFLNTEVFITQEDDPLAANAVILNAKVYKKNKIKINEIIFEGNVVFSDKKLRKTMKNTKKKDWNIFKGSKYIEADFKEDKQSINEKYNQNGYRDIKIVKDSISVLNDKKINLYIKIEEGHKYYYRNITWVGNTKYPSELLDAWLGVKKGDPFDQSLLDNRIIFDENPPSISTRYMDDGYLFSSINPVEVLIENDSIDLEIRIYEGQPATINKIIIKGNTKTNEHVIRRELRTKPGELFSKTNIIRSIRELAQLGHFDPEKITPNPISNPAEGTVDLEYILEEATTDRFEVSGGWGANMLVGTIGITFGNFSIRKIFSRDAWHPVPSGDGQTLSIRAQSNGNYYQSYNMTFIEPWLGGKKPNSLSISFFTTVQSNGRSKGELNRKSITTSGASIGIGRRLSWPDDYFVLYNEISYHNYELNNWDSYFLFSNGISKNLSFKTTFSRNSSGPSRIYPITGSNFSLSLQLTPPYSAFSNKDYSLLPDNEKYKWIEYHKWLFTASTFSTLAGFSRKLKLVVNVKAQFGYLGKYNDGIGPSPFEGFDLGGDGMIAYSLYGRQIIAMRGYEDGSLTPTRKGTDGILKKAGNIYNKLTVELRFPLSLNPQATIYGLVFLEAGNAWYDFSEFNPFSIKRSAGLGLRAFLPMFGMLGIDWGYGFDEIPGKPGANKGQFHFVIGQQF